MKNLFIVITALSGMLLLFAGCPIRHYYDTATIPEKPVNLSGINSEYDDYNSALHMYRSDMALVFSTNRQSKGGDFDFTYYYLIIQRDLESGKYYIGEHNFKHEGFYLNSLHLLNAITHVNTTGYNEFGPFMVWTQYGFPYAEKCIMMYSSNAGGNQDIRFTENLHSASYTEPQPVTFLNSEKEDAYPSVSSDSSAIYFCSDRDSNFDIYRATLDVTKTFYRNITSQSAISLSKETALNSGYDDKCPFVNGNLLVFASNRPGGYGGFDLYYSVFANGQWSAPVNFGPTINTTADEYRPVVKQLPEFTNDFMLFSSNRSGGQGGYDLYFVGISKMTAQAGFPW